MKKLTFLSLLLAFNSFSTTAFEGPQALQEIQSCQAKHKSRMDYARCLDSVLNQLDREMKTWENNLEFKLQDMRNNGGNAEALNLFKKSKKEYDKYRKANCQWQYLALLPDVASASAMLKECQVYMTKDRIEKLKEVNQFDF